MKDIVIKVLKNINFAQIYQHLCNHYNNFHNGINFKKNEINNILKNNNINLDFSSNEKTFYKEYYLSEITVNFAMTYKHGFIECFYTIWNKDNSIRILGRFNSIATLQNSDFNNMVNHKFPIATSLEDLNNILEIIFKLHDDFIKNLKVELDISIEF
jgi:hypothetical protein